MIFKSGIRITQYYGENPESYSRFGLLGHDGLDVVPNSADDDWMIYAYAEGKVVQCYFSDTYGNTVITYNKGNNISVRYAHLERIDVKLGDRILVGMALGKMGNTGNSFGAHLHTHIVPSQPYGNKLFPDNGYKGRMDPLPLLIASGQI